MCDLTKWYWHALVLMLMAVASRAEAVVYNFADQGEAYAACQAGMANIEPYETANGFKSEWTNPGGSGTGYRCVMSSTTQFRCQAILVHPVGGYGGHVACTSLASGSDYYQFPLEKNCESRNATLGQPERVYKGEAPSCVAGCALTHGATSDITIAGEKTIFTSNTQYSGETCKLDPGESEPPVPGPATPDTDEACTPLGAGQTACVKPDGSYCASASNGKTFCWNRNETGEKVDPPNLQRRVSGSTRPDTAPTTPPPEGQEWHPNDSHGSRSSSGNSYTVINYSPEQGDNGHTDPQDGGNGDGEDEEGEDGTVSGGGSCAEAPVCTDGDSEGCQNVIQTWYLRCKGVDLTGGDTCDAPPECVGNAGDCYIGRSLWKMRCETVEGEIGVGLETALNAAEGADWADPELPTDDEITGGDDPIGESREIRGNDWLTEQLSEEGFLTDSACPSVSPIAVGAASIALTFGPLCQTLINMSGIIMALAYFMAFRILAN